MRRVNSQQWPLPMPCQKVDTVPRRGLMLPCCQNHIWPSVRGLPEQLVLLSSFSANLRCHISTAASSARTRLHVAENLLWLLPCCNIIATDTAFPRVTSKGDPRGATLLWSVCSPVQWAEEKTWQAQQKGGSSQGVQTGSSRQAKASHDLQASSTTGQRSGLHSVCHTCEAP